VFPFKNRQLFVWVLYFQIESQQKNKNHYCFAIVTVEPGIWDMETWLDRKHHCSEKVAHLIKYIDLIGYIGIFVSTLDFYIKKQVY
jgi:hypothetical protein